ncbi:MAG: response regulator [candidate division WOR-3 bacterium]
MILVVEDNKALRMILKKALQRAGYEVRVAENGEEGLKVLNEETPELIISDVVMPEMDGFEFIKKVREKFPIIPFIFLTVKSEIDEYSKGYELGATDYITKPFNGALLVKKVKKRLEASRLMKEIVDRKRSEVEIDKIFIVEFINTLKEQKVDCRLLISSPFGDGIVEIKGGKIKKSKIADLEGEKALSKIASLNKGEIKIEF